MNNYNRKQNIIAIIGIVVSAIVAIIAAIISAGWIPNPFSPDTSNASAAADTTVKHNRNGGTAANTSITTSNSNNNTTDTTINISDDARQYNGHSYKIYIVQDPITWEEACKKCEENGGYLATINDEKENEWLFDYTQEVCATYNSNEMAAYFGLYNRSVDENYTGSGWKWVDGENFNPTLANTLWYKDEKSPQNNEPKNLNKNEYYGLFYYKGTPNAMWHTGDFTYNEELGYTSYICEWNQ